MGLGLFWKPSGIGSQQFLGELRKNHPRLLEVFSGPKKKGKSEIGHTGTLDPFASGLLLVGWKEGTKLLGGLVGQRKTYVGTFLFGIESDSLDRTGNIVLNKENSGFLKEFFEPLYKDPAKAQAKLDSLKGTSFQVPPLASAIKLDGQRAYEVFRSGSESDKNKVLGMLEAQKSRPIEIYSIKSLGLGPANFYSEGHEIGGLWRWKIEVSVSSGTYIRCFARDWPKKWELPQGGLLEELCRIKIGPLGLAEGFSFSRGALLNDLSQVSEIFALVRASAQESHSLLKYGRLEAGLRARAKQELSKLEIGEAGPKPLLVVEDSTGQVVATLGPGGEIGRVFQENPLTDQKFTDFRDSGLSQSSLRD